MRLEGAARLAPRARGAPVIRVAGLDKRFRKYTARGGYTTIKSSLLRRWFGGGAASAPRWLQVLDGIEFEVRRGTAFGIVGQNGSGKSTLLKILAGILKPDRGTVAIDGRVSPLIELGAGFHPEFSGRENVHLNGIVLGMSRAEIEQRFDAIVDFAELRDSIDDPVRTYSSGMYMRLGFAIAAHSAPDLLLVDEILAVGDQGFARKCEQWLADFLAGGGTVVLVSHDPAAIERWCDEAIWLDGGRIRERGTPRRVLSAYQQTVVTADAATTAGPAYPSSRDGAPFEVERVAVRDADGMERSHFRFGEAISFDIEGLRTADPGPVAFAVGVRRADGIACFATSTIGGGAEIDPVPGPARIRCRLARIPLVDGSYQVDVAVGRPDGTVLYQKVGAALFFVESGHLSDVVVILDHEWSIEPNPGAPLAAANR